MPTINVSEEQLKYFNNLKNFFEYNEKRNVNQGQFLEELMNWYATNGRKKESE